MNLLAQFLLTTTDGLLLLALFTCPPVVFTLLSRKSVRFMHVAINGFLFVVFAVPAAFFISHVEPGSGMGGAVMLVAGVGAGGLALAFLVATFATALVLALRSEGQSSTRLTKSNINRSKPSTPPLLDQFAQWKATYRRPRATYQEFLEEAHPRYFPVSFRGVIVAVILLAAVGYLILR